MKRIIFQQIADNRFCDDIFTEIKRLKRKTDEALKKIGAKNKASGEYNFLKWGDGTTQYRVDYIVEKKKDFTYNDLYKAVNSVKACYYKVK